MMDRALTLKEVEAATRQRQPSIHAAIKRGDLRVYKVGRRTYARESAVQSWLDFLQRQSDAGKPVFYRARVEA